MRKGMERERKRRRLEAERREPNGVRSDPIFRKECGGGYSSSWERRRVRSFFSRRETWTWVMERRAAVFA